MLQKWIIIDYWHPDHKTETKYILIKRPSSGYSNNKGKYIRYKNSKYILTKQTAAKIQNVFWPNFIYLGKKYKMGHRYYCSRVLDVTDHQDLIEQRGNQIFTGMFSLISSRMIKWKSCNKVSIYSPRAGKSKLYKAK